jgi:hypothetical protein
LLQLSIVAVNSDCVSGVMGKPEVRNTRLLRPGKCARFLAMPRSASITLRIPKLASTSYKDGMPSDATSTGAVGEVKEPFNPATAFFNSAVSAVKF